MQEGLDNAEAGSVLKCLEPRAKCCSYQQDASAWLNSVASGAGGERGGGESRTAPEEKNVFRTHTCWVKAGHDVLHERKPFLMALLHKVRSEKTRVSAFSDERAELLS